MNAATTKFTVFSKVIDGVKVTFISQYYGRAEVTQGRKIINVQCPSSFGGLRTSSRSNYADALKVACELVKLEIQWRSK